MIFGRRGKCALQTYGAECLKTASAPVAHFDRELAELAMTMGKALKQLNGIGLAAVQIGVPMRLILLDVAAETLGTPPTPGELAWLPQMPLALANPEIIAHGSELVPHEEGCLSVPELYAPVLRPRLVTVRAQLLDGRTVEAECGGMLARCLQHEIDHLNGVLFVDRLTPEVRQTVELELENLLRRGKRRRFAKELRV